MKVVQVSAVSVDGWMYLYFLLDDGRVFRRRKRQLFEKGDIHAWEEVDLSGLLALAALPSEPAQKEKP